MFHYIFVKYGMWRDLLSSGLSLRILMLQELNAFITTVDWSTDGTLLRANDDNFQHYIC